MKAALLLLCLLALSPARADQTTICYNYGCAVRASVTFDSAEMAQIRQLFRDVTDPASERGAISRAVGLFETFAGRQTPTYRDKGGNVDDDGVDGRMDCIDHSHNTTAYLQILAQNGLLRFHRVLPRVKRAPWLFDVHWSAQIEELDNHHDYVVDSWFFDNGHPAAVLDLQDWLRGAGPRG